MNGNEQKSNKIAMALGEIEWQATAMHRTSDIEEVNLRMYVCVCELRWP